LPQHPGAWAEGEGAWLLVAAYAGCQALYFCSYLVELYFYTRPIDWVDPDEARRLPPEQYPFIVILYPVLRELEATMRTTMLALARLQYPRDRFRVVAIPNADDVITVGHLLRLAHDFPFLDVMAVPPTSNRSWQLVWDHWTHNPAAYWWHTGKRARVTDLPPKKTRQLIYALYTLARRMRPMNSNWLLGYLDADSVPPPNHLLATAAGIQQFDVLQCTNVAGNPFDSWVATWCTQDHMSWDGLKYPHMSAHGSHPYYVLGKGLFFRASDLIALGGFNPWLTIEDPEVGMRFWAAKPRRRIGIIAAPLIEEVPMTLRGALRQRSRWVCGFFQSLSAPLTLMGMSFWQRQLARLNFLPTLLLLVNIVGLPTGVWAILDLLSGSGHLPASLTVLSLTNVAAYVVLMAYVYQATWRRTALVLSTRRERIAYMWRINPISLWIWWLIWIVPLCVGFQMFLRDRGQVWDRTEKIDANNGLVRERVSAHARGRPRQRA
jgi:cellulose synthase/poly-beta-1,6-N-acetylglucosamine synthase-like glycosyltransferase